MEVGREKMEGKVEGEGKHAADIKIKGSDGGVKGSSTMGRGGGHREGDFGGSIEGGVWVHRRI